ncbi:MAG: hypothetical protein ABI867_37860 [Kofleriaceae bacterium]
MPGPPAPALVARTAAECDGDSLCSALAADVTIDYAVNDVVVADPTAMGIRTTTRAPTSMGTEWRALQAFTVRCTAADQTFTLRAGADPGGGTAGYRDLHGKLASRDVTCHCE